jgi:hypothetical protein
MKRDRTSWLSTQNSLSGEQKVISEPGGALMVDFASLLDDCHWASTHFIAGDVLIFTALTCHMGVPPPSIDGSSPNKQL